MSSIGIIFVSQAPRQSDCSNPRIFSQRTHRKRHWMLRQPSSHWIQNLSRFHRCYSTLLLGNGGGDCSTDVLVK